MARLIYKSKKKLKDKIYHPTRFNWPIAYDSTDHFVFVCPDCNSISDIYEVSFDPMVSGLPCIYFTLVCHRCGIMGTRKIYLGKQKPVGERLPTKFMPLWEAQIVFDNKRRRRTSPRALREMRGESGEGGGNLGRSRVLRVSGIAKHKRCHQRDREGEADRGGRLPRPCPPRPSKPGRILKVAQGRGYLSLEQSEEKVGGLSFMYRTILIDPPWLERGAGKIKRGADRHYPLLKTDEIISTIKNSGVFNPPTTATSTSGLPTTS